MTQLTDTLRLATREDIPTLCEMSRKFFDASPFAYWDYSAAKVEGILSAALLDPKNYVLLASVDGDKVVGFLAGTKQVPLFSTDTVTIEIGWWLDPEYRDGRRAMELLDGYIEWAKLIGAKHVNMALMANPDHDVQKIMKLRSFKHSEQGFTMSL